MLQVKAEPGAVKTTRIFHYKDLLICGGIPDWNTEHQGQKHRSSLVCEVYAIFAY